MRLIDADALKKLRRCEIDEYADGWTFKELWEVEEANIDSLPTIEPQIVRCKDCRWWERDYQPRYYHYPDERPCNIVGMGTPPEWFCADGERREDAD